MRPAGREVALDEETRELIERLEARLAEAAFQPPSAEELTASLGCGAKKLAQVTAMLVDAGRLVPLSADHYIGETVAARGREAVVENCQRNGQLVIPELRDVLGTTRKYLIPLLERFDLEGLTLRQGGHRVLKKR